MTMVSSPVWSKNLLIICTDTVIWMGDFNYRIGLGIERVKQLIKIGDLETLYENDQVRFLSKAPLRITLTQRS
jgi:hypothetical protein